jgi:hypothetical protein
MTVMGQEKTDKKKQEQELMKKKEQVSIIIDAKKDAQFELQQALQESIEAEQEALELKFKEGYMDNKTYQKDLETLMERQKKLKDLESLYHGDFWGPNSGFAIAAPSMRYKFDAESLGNLYMPYDGRRENTSISISKTLEDVTLSLDFSYDVKAESSSISFFVTGTLKAGELQITLKRPDKTAFQEINISPLADVNWNQSFRWEEEDSEEYIGKWIISISAAKANGNYKVQVNSR